jgi:hypothetical protein
VIGASIVFVSVIGIIMEWLPLAVTAMLGSPMLVVSNILTLDLAIDYIASSHPTLGLFFMSIFLLIGGLQYTLVVAPTF